MNAGPSLDGSRWTTRAPDEVYPSVDALQAALSTRRDAATTVVADLDALVPEVCAHGVAFRFDGMLLHPTPWAAARLCAAVGLPVKAVQVLSPGLSALALAERIGRVSARDRSRALLLAPRPDGDFTLRAVDGPDYARVWDADLLAAFAPALAADGWAPAQSAPNRVGLFSSDRDFFAFFTREGQGFRPTGHPRPLRRGLLLRNSEVGGIALRATSFWFDDFCTNHHIFGVTDHLALRVLHVRGGETPLDRLLGQWEAFGGLARLDEPPAELDAVVGAAAAWSITHLDRSSSRMGDELVAAILPLAELAGARTVLRPSTIRTVGHHLRAMEHPIHDGGRVSLWSFADAMTHWSQRHAAFTDARAGYDAAMGRLLRIHAARAPFSGPLSLGGVSP